MKDEMIVLALGDIILGDDSSFFMSGVKDILQKADLRIGQLEVPYTSRAKVMEGLSREPERLEPLAGCMDIMTLAGNHIYDAGEVGIEDTLKWLDCHHVRHTGGGMTLNDAKKPAFFEKDGCKIGVLNYNCTGPKSTWANDQKAGCAYVEVITHYSLGDVANPGGMPDKIETFPTRLTLEAMEQEIAVLKKDCDIVMVYFHKGIVHRPVKLADYEFVVAHRAIDAGADVIFSSHSHILHGIEVYKGKTIYHGLGNGVAWVPSLRPDFFNGKTPGRNEVFDPKAWAKQRIERFGFIPDPEYLTYPFHPDAIYTILAKCVIRDRQIVKALCVPAIVGKDGVTRIVDRTNGGQDVLDYLKMITKGAGLNAEYTWDGDQIVIGERK